MRGLFALAGSFLLLASILAAFPAAASPVVVLQRIEGESAMSHAGACGGDESMRAAPNAELSGGYAMEFPNDHCWATYGFDAHQDGLMTLTVLSGPPTGGSSGEQECVVWEAYLDGTYSVGSQPHCGQAGIGGWKHLTLFQDVHVAQGGHIVKIVSRISQGPAYANAYLDYVESALAPAPAPNPTASSGTATTAPPTPTYHQDCYRDGQMASCPQPTSHQDCYGRDGQASTCQEPAPACRSNGELERALAEHRARWEERRKAFQVEFDRARSEFSQAAHSDEEWKAFHAKWEAAFRAQHDAFSDEQRALAEKHGMGRCFPEQHPAPAAPAHEMDEGARRIIERCEARMKALYADGQPQRGDPAGGEAARREFESKERAIREQCELEMREYMSQKHAERDERFGSFVMRMDGDRIVVDGKHVDLVGLPDRQWMTEISVHGKVLVDALYANGYLQFKPEQTPEGSAIQVRDGSGSLIMSVHDNPRGVINLATSAEIPSITLDLHDALILKQDGEGIRFEFGGWSGAVLVHRGSVETAAGNVLTIQGKATFLVSDGPARADEEQPRPAYDKAILEKKIGAEVYVDGDGAADSTPIGDMQVKGAKLEGRKLSARVDSPDGKGKTVVFKVAPGLIPCGALSVKIWAVEADGTEHATEIRQASGLEDILDPTNDGAEGFEFWCVSDKNGEQILVSFAHFSEKRVEIESAGDDALSLVPGFEAAILAAAAGGALVLVGARRRK